MTKTSLRWLPVAVVIGAVGSVVVSCGCGGSTPPPAPAIEEPQTEEYTQGEASYYNQGQAPTTKKKAAAKTAAPKKTGAKSAAPK